MTEEKDPVVLAIEPLAVRRATAARLLECSVTSIWKLCRSGQLETIKVGSDDRILLSSIRRFAGQPSAIEGARPRAA